MRYQSEIVDTTRESALEGSQRAIKIGAAGKVLLGPAGNAGSFSVPLRMAILRKSDNEPGIAKLYRASVTVPSGQTEGEFTVISKPLCVPFIQDHAQNENVVAIQEGSALDKKGPKGAKR
jgi:hypothetical protein